MSRAAPQRTDEELVEAIAAADEDALAELYDRFGKVAFMVSKIRERYRGRTLLPLKEHRNLRPEQQQ